MNGSDLHARIFAVLEAHDSLCMDILEERELLAVALARSLELYGRQAVDGGGTAIQPAGHREAEVVLTSKVLLAEADQ
jgi:hypothetical protein